MRGRLRPRPFPPYPRWRLRFPERGAFRWKRRCFPWGWRETGSAEVEYALAGGFADMAVLTADPSIAVAVLTDNGDGTAKMTAAAAAPGTTVAAVYRISNPAVVDYITIRSGLAEDGEVYTQMNGNQSGDGL